MPHRVRHRSKRDGEQSRIGLWRWRGPVEARSTIKNFREQSVRSCMKNRRFDVVIRAEVFADSDWYIHQPIKLALDKPLEEWRREFASKIVSADAQADVARQVLLPNYATGSRSSFPAATSRDVPRRGSDSRKILAHVHRGVPVRSRSAPKEISQAPRHTRQLRGSMRRVAPIGKMKNAPSGTPFAMRAAASAWSGWSRGSSDSENVPLPPETLVVAPHFFSLGGAVETAQWIKRVVAGEFEVDPAGDHFRVWN
jgi:hypothetical protein